MLPKGHTFTPSIYNVFLYIQNRELYETLKEFVGDFTQNRNDKKGCN